MRADDIRRTFLSFFEDRGHRVVPSSSLIPADPTLLLTNAGMVQFKPYFLGQEPAPYPTATSVQKCFRVVDIEEVGDSPHHDTFFEMLGNFSFGEYFKREAAAFAWELLTGPFAIDPARLWVSVFETDDEAAAIWEEHVGVHASRIVRFGKEDNFWQMGVPGPCGPCSEIFVDRGPDYGPEAEHGPVDGTDDRYPEIWNLVFMQYVQDEPFNVVGELERTGIDTGMGLERLARILQDVPTIFDTDLFAPIVTRAEEITGARIDAGPDQARLLRILADHARAVTFLIADGVAPSNEGRGYVLRRVLRRAVTKARVAGVTDAVLRPLCDVVVDRFGEAYPELVRNREGILELAAREEERFSRTLDAGLGMLSGAVADANAAGTGLSGEVAFRLHDTYGFPLEITRDVAEESGLSVDEDAFARLMDEQRMRSRSATTQDKADALGAAVRIDLPATEFLGYDTRTAEANVLAVLRSGRQVDAATEGDQVLLVLDRTPFYAEAGGQIGDRGWVETGGARGEVLDTQTHGLVIAHTVRLTGGELRPGETVHAVVSPAHRSGVERAHTATHMMHHTLRELVGEHVRQMGSLVEPGRLRFDFSHFSAVGRETLDEVEETVNARVLADDPVRWFETGYTEAVQQLGAIAFFEDKYGDSVRVVEVGDYSRELCGGTHVGHTGRIGLVKLLTEGSIGSNIRRVEALTGVEGLRYVNARLRAMEHAAELARVPADELVDGIERLLRTQKELQRALAEQQQRSAAGAADELLSTARDLPRGRVIVARRDEDPKTLEKLAESLRDKLDPGVVILGTAGDGKANIVAAVSPGLAREGVEAPAILNAGAAHIGGRAGGKPAFARGGGGQPSGLDAALHAAGAEAERLLG